MHADIPFIDKSKVPGSKRWMVLKVMTTTTAERGLSRAADGVLAYSFDDLRISIVYRARCFADQEEADRFRAQLHGKDGEGGRMSMDEVLSKFVGELVRMGKLKEGSTLDSLDRLELSLLILDTFITYPLPSTPLIPWNYCALSRLAPALRGPLSAIC